MKTIRVEDAVGTVLCHDITKVVPGEFKGAAFKKGHIIRAEDVPELLRLGKENLFVWECGEGMLHENEAAQRLADAVGGEGLIKSEPSEGRITLKATADGMVDIDEERLIEMNMIDDIVIATISNRRPVKAGDDIAGVRVVPLIEEASKLEAIEAIADGRPVISVRAFKPLRVGIITTGSEVYRGLIEDRFGPVLTEKAAQYGCTILGQNIVPDNAEVITAAIHQMVDEGADMILTTGGMSVDPDDVTPLGVRNTGAEIICYGAPVLPGAMIMMAYLNDIPIMGLPGCVMYRQTTIFDLLLPMALCGKKITRRDIARMGLGGFCLNCPTCHFPACSFGTGA